MSGETRSSRNETIFTLKSKQYPRFGLAARHTLETSRRCSIVYAQLAHFGMLKQKFDVNFSENSAVNFLKVFSTVRISPRKTAKHRTESCCLHLLIFLLLVEPLCKNKHEGQTLFGGYSTFQDVQVATARVFRQSSKLWVSPQRRP